MVPFALLHAETVVGPVHRATRHPLGLRGRGGRRGGGVARCDCLLVQERIGYRLAIEAIGYRLVLRKAWEDGGCLEDAEERRGPCNVGQQRLDLARLHLRRRLDEVLLPVALLAAPAPRHRLTALGHAPQPRVPVVFDRVVRAAGKVLCNLGPFVAHLALLGDEDVVLLLGPRILTDGRVKLIVPSLAALLAIAPGKVLGNLSPSIGTIDSALLGHEPAHGVVLLEGPWALRTGTNVGRCGAVKLVRNRGHTHAAPSGAWRLV